MTTPSEMPHMEQALKSLSNSPFLRREELGMLLKHFDSLPHTPPPENQAQEQSTSDRPEPLAPEIRISLLTLDAHITALQGFVVRMRGRPLLLQVVFTPFALLIALFYRAKAMMVQFQTGSAPQESGDLRSSEQRFKLLQAMLCGVKRPDDYGLENDPVFQNVSARTRRLAGKAQNICSLEQETAALRQQLQHSPGEKQ